MADRSNVPMTTRSRSHSTEPERHVSHAALRKRRHQDEQQRLETDCDSGHPEINGIKIYADTEEKEMECAVCLSPCLYPTVLPCGHIFCYLCIKGSIRTGSNTCPMCRSDIPGDLLYKPILYEPLSNTERDDSLEYKWFYQRRRASGWWQYDERTSNQIETAYKSGEKLVEILIVGEIYVIDLESNWQFQKRDPLRRRRIVRSTVKDIEVKGWWQFDENTSEMLEHAFKSGKKKVDVTIAGFKFIIDIEYGIQSRKTGKMSRRIKRAQFQNPIGIAGIRYRSCLTTYSNRKKYRIPN